MPSFLLVPRIVVGVVIVMGLAFWVRCWSARN